MSNDFNPFKVPEIPQRRNMRNNTENDSAQVRPDSSSYYVVDYHPATSIEELNEMARNDRRILRSMRNSRRNAATGRSEQHNRSYPNTIFSRDESPSNRATSDSSQVSSSGTISTTESEDIAQKRPRKKSILELLVEAESENSTRQIIPPDLRRSAPMESSDGAFKVIFMTDASPIPKELEQLRPSAAPRSSGEVSMFIDIDLSNPKLRAIPNRTEQSNNITDNTIPQAERSETNTLRSYRNAPRRESRQNERESLRPSQRNGTKVTTVDINRLHAELIEQSRALRERPRSFQLVSKPKPKATSTDENISSTCTSELNDAMEAIRQNRWYPKGLKERPQNPSVIQSQSTTRSEAVESDTNSSSSAYESSTYRNQRSSTQVAPTPECSSYNNTSSTKEKTWIQAHIDNVIKRNSSIVNRSNASSNIKNGIVNPNMMSHIDEWIQENPRYRNTAFPRDLPNLQTSRTTQRNNHTSSQQAPPSTGLRSLVRAPTFPRRGRTTRLCLSHPKCFDLGERMFFDEFYRGVSYNPKFRFTPYREFAREKETDVYMPPTRGLNNFHSPIISTNKPVDPPPYVPTWKQSKNSNTNQTNTMVPKVTTSIQCVDSSSDDDDDDKILIIDE